MTEVVCKPLYHMDKRSVFPAMVCVWALMLDSRQKNINGEVLFYLCFKGTSDIDYNYFD